MANVEIAHKNEPNRTEIDDLVTKTMFGIRKSSASSSADTFLKIGKHVSKMARSAHFFCFIPNYGSSGACPQKSQTGLKMTIWWLKQCSVIEKVKPHRARIPFRKMVKNVSKMVRSAPFFLLYNQLWVQWRLPTENEPNRTTIDDLVTKTKFGDRKS